MIGLFANATRAALGAPSVPKGPPASNPAARAAWLRDVIAQLERALADGRVPERYEAQARRQLATWKRELAAILASAPVPPAGQAPDPGPASGAGAGGSGGGVVNCLVPPCPGDGEVFGRELVCANATGAPTGDRLLLGALGGLALGLLLVSALR